MTNLYCKIDGKLAVFQTIIDYEPASSYLRAMHGIKGAILMVVK